MHGDGAANDGVYGVDIQILDSQMEYYIYTENADAGKFSPVRAAYEFYTVSPSKGVVINELMANNGNTQQDTDGEFDDWIELYNNSSSAIDLSGYYLSDNPNSINKWQFPEGSVINSGDYLIIWADNDTLQQGLHANFKLSAAGESVLLSNASMLVIDSTSFPYQQENVSFGRLPNGTGSFTFLAPTFAAINESEVFLSVEPTVINNFNVYPNPAVNQITISLSFTPSDTTYEIISYSGQTVKKGIVNSQKTTIDLGSLSSGIYLIKVGNIIKKLVLS